MSPVSRGRNGRRKNSLGGPPRRTSYAGLLDILGEPGHPEHPERLEWLGLRRATDLDPAHFDPAEVTQDLSVLR